MCQLSTAQLQKHHLRHAAALKARGVVECRRKYAAHRTLPVLVHARDVDIMEVPEDHLVLAASRHTPRVDTADLCTKL